MYSAYGVEGYSTEYNSYPVCVVNLPNPIHLSAGRYWLMVAPHPDLGRNFIGTASGANCIATPCGNDGLSYFTSTTFGYYFAPAASVPGISGPSTNAKVDLSMGLLDVVNWPQFRSDPSHTGYQPFESTLSPATVGNLVLKWQSFLGKPLFPSPAVANDVVYVGSEGGNVYALNASDGSVKWMYLTGDYVDSSPAVANGVVTSVLATVTSMLWMPATTELSSRNKL